MWLPEKGILWSNQGNFLLFYYLFELQNSIIKRKHNHCRTINKIISQMYKKTINYGSIVVKTNALKNNK